jgi:hypothetical protein
MQLVYDEANLCYGEAILRWSIHVIMVRHNNLMDRSSLFMVRRVANF